MGQRIEKGPGVTELLIMHASLSPISHSVPPDLLQMDHLHIVGICRHLTDPFSMQDVVDQVYAEAPELVCELPVLWGDLRAMNHIRHTGLDVTRYTLSPELNGVAA